MSGQEFFQDQLAGFEARVNARFADMDRRIGERLSEINQKLGVIMTQQNDIASDTAAIETAVTAIQAADAALSTAVTNIGNALAAAKAANPSVDLTALDAAVNNDLAGAVSQLGSAVGSVSSLAPTTTTPAS